MDKGDIGLTSAISFPVSANCIDIDVLPKHFHRIRYYGFLANGQGGRHIAAIRQALNDRNPHDAEPQKEQPPQCPVCGKENMITILVLDGHGNVVVKEDFPNTETKQVPPTASEP
ncbi:hypothetical protein [Desulfobacter hydrogenophilus]|uniref:hypothetical protein n=1 Tax=Desulfobacter hydrogenophilus TaxID=2291 RepID=UPI001BA60B4B|nr:hypothetical protein [Desulfobacter hydrogenophilus]